MKDDARRYWIYEEGASAFPIFFQEQLLHIVCCCWNFVAKEKSVIEKKMAII